MPCCSGRPPHRPLIIVVDGNKEAESLSEAVETFFRLIAAEDRRRARNSCRRSTFCRCRTCRRTPRSWSSAPSGLWRLATQRAPITILPVASALLRIEPGEFYRQLALRLKAGDESAARGSGRASGKHRLRTPRAGRDGGRVLGPRRHPRRLLARIARSPFASTFSATRWNPSAASTWNRSARSSRSRIARCCR